ncbi:MAG: response regulator [Desulfobacterales bacterium]|nr:response regulator [Desulfobacterales bacterium]
MNKNNKILIIDDDISPLEGHIRLLQTEGYIVKTAETGEDGLQLVIKEKPELVILDVVLPDEDGYEICKQIKFLPDFQAPYIKEKPELDVLDVVFSGMDDYEICKQIKFLPDFQSPYIVMFSAQEIDTESQIRGFEAGADDYLTKPIDRKQLSARIKAIFRTINAEKERENLKTQLAQYKKMEAIGTLAGGIAHEFNNLLFIIMGNVEMLIRKANSGDEHLLKVLKDIYSTTNRGADLIKSLLTFSRKIDHKKEQFYLNEIIEKILSMLEKLIQRTILIESDLANDLYKINAAINLTEQVLLNLCMNAQDAMPNGGKLIIKTQNIEIYESDNNKYPDMKVGSYVLLVVSDNGCGIDKSIQDRIFDPFFSTKEVGKGTGLGLSTVYGFVKAHNGYIFCESEFGHGTTFKLYLPAFTGAKEYIT